MIRFLLAGSAVAALAGCASITTDSTQLMRVDALDEQGAVVADAKCDLSNGKGMYQTETGKHVMISKAGENMNIRCQSQSRTDVAEGTAISRPGPGMFGNIIFGGGIGAIIDHSSGKAYKYPEWVQVVFGRILVFDRTEHQDGMPMQGKTAAEVKQAQAAKTQ